MANKFDEMRDALNEAEHTFAAADRMASTMARILCGRLRHVSPYTLETLKRELREFNAHTKEWKS